MLPQPQQVLHILERVCYKPPTAVHLGFRAGKNQSISFLLYLPLPILQLSFLSMYYCFSCLEIRNVSALINGQRDGLSIVPLNKFVKNFRTFLQSTIWSPPPPKRKAEGSQFDESGTARVWRSFQGVKVTSGIHDAHTHSDSFSESEKT